MKQKNKTKKMGTLFAGIDSSVWTPQCLWKRRKW